MIFWIEQFLGVIRPLHPFRWRILVRGLRRSEGWTPPMMLIASLGVLAGLNAGFGLLGGIALVQWLNYFSLATWLIVASVATIAVLKDSVNNLFRFGGFRFSRPRWWFELSRTAWIIGLALGLTAMLVAILSLPIADAFTNLIFILAVSNVAVFLIGTTIGLMICVVHRRSPRGRAYECVEYFYMLIVAGFIASFLALYLPRVLPIGFNAAAFVATMLIAVLVAVYTVRLGKRWQTGTEQTPHNKTIDRSRQSLSRWS